MPDPIDPIVPTPPVTDAGIVHGEGGYSGPDRRRTDPLALAIQNAVTRVQPPKQGGPNIVRDIIKDVAIVALVGLCLISQFRLADKQNQNNDEQRRFRTGVGCFLVEQAKIDGTDLASRQREYTDMLTRCGFITAPGSVQQKGD